MGPLKYLSLKDSKKIRIASKRIFISLVVSVIISIVFVYFIPINIFGKSGLVEKIGAFASTLTGFYVAALVAVTTFGQGLPEMEGKMPSGQIYIYDQGRQVEVNRREYLTALFGYLVLLTFIVSIFSIVLPLIGSSVSEVSYEISIYGRIIQVNQSIGFIVSSLYFWMLVNLITETSIGLDYLVDKIYRKHPKVISGSLKSLPKKTEVKIDND